MSHSHQAAFGQGRAFASIAQLVIDAGQTFGRCRDLIWIWRRRWRERRMLRLYPEHLIRDMGLDLHHAEIESRKPFWQP
jgi:uncharacterized protein YjiS (DUF1127 family)